MKKVCTVCSEPKDLEEFHKSKTGKHGVIARCKVCKRTQDREYGRKNKEKADVRAKKWYQDNKEKAKERITEWQRSDHGKAMRKANHLKRCEENPEWWRSKKKRDKTARRCRELNAGPLDISSIVYLENYNIKTFTLQGFTCEYCNEFLGDSYDLEHIVPLSKEGTNKLENLAISCYKCNRGEGGKGSTLLEEWNPKKIEYFSKRNTTWKPK